MSFSSDLKGELSRITPDKKQEELAEWGDSTIQIGRAYHEGHIGYHVRRGTHALCREDWQLIMEYRDKTNS